LIEPGQLAYPDKHTHPGKPIALKPLMAMPLAT
jgi:hypothetical protein